MILSIITLVINKKKKPVHPDQDFGVLLGHIAPCISFVDFSESKLYGFKSALSRVIKYRPYFDPFRSFCLADSTIDISFPVQTGTRLFKQIQTFS